MVTIPIQKQQPHVVASHIVALLGLFTHYRVKQASYIIITTISMWLKMARRSFNILVNVWLKSVLQ